MFHLFRICQKVKQKRKQKREGIDIAVWEENRSFDFAY